MSFFGTKCYVFVLISLLFFDIFPCNFFCFYVKSFLYGCRKLFSNFVRDEDKNDLHHEYRMTTIVNRVFDWLAISLCIY